MEAVMILPETERGAEPGQMDCRGQSIWRSRARQRARGRSMVEGYVRVIPTPLASTVRTTSAYPSTIGCADGPPPRAGEDL